MSRPRCAAFLAVLLLSAPAAAQDAGFLNKSAQQWAQELKHRQPAVRRNAAFALGQMGVDAAGLVPQLVGTLEGDADPSVQEAAAYALGQIGPSFFDDRCVPALLKAVATSRDADVRRSAAFALGRLGDGAGRRTPPQQKELAEQVAPVLRQALTDDQPAVRQNAAWALGQYGEGAGAEAVKALTQAMARDGDALVRRDAAVALGKAGRAARASAAALLTRFKDDRDVVVRKTALASLVGVVGEEHRELAPQLQRLLEDDDEEVARSAALALANIGGEKSRTAVPLLRRALQDGDPLTRRLAANGLANVGEYAAAAAGDLAAALGDEDREVRRGAAQGLGRIGEPAKAAVPALIRRLADTAEDEEVRKFAAEAVAAIDPNHPDAAAAIVKVLHEKDAYPVRHRCIWVLRGLRDFKQPGVVDAVTRLLSEEGPRAKSVRYESAVTLALWLRDGVPEKTFDVLQEALADDTVIVYTGTGAQVSTGAAESRTGSARVEEKGAGDWRSEVAKACGAIGKKANRKEIAAGLKKVARDSPDPEARKAAADALKAIQ